MRLNWPDTFSVVEMTDAVNKLPLMPLRFGGMFETTGIPTTHGLRLQARPHQPHP